MIKRLCIAALLVFTTSLLSFADEQKEITLNDDNHRKETIELGYGNLFVSLKNADNDGNIGFRLLNLGKTPYEIKVGDRIGQGIFVKYTLVKDDNAKGSRTGGFGSTN